MVEILADNEMARWSLLALLFMAVVTVSFAVASVVGSRRAVRDRLSPEATAPATDLLSPGSLRSAYAESAWLKLVERIEKSGLNLADTKDQALRQRLAAAGWPAPHASRVYTLIRLGLVIGLPVLLLSLLWLSGSRPGIGTIYFGGLIAALVGLYVPALFVRAKADRRQQKIINGFPDALDLMLVCVEAGLGLEAAFARVGQEMTSSHPLIAEQFGTVVLEMRAGRSREDALRRMADRAEVDEIRAFATLLIQSTKLGSSIAQTLRVYASEMRDKRRMRAEEKAHRLPVLLSIPLVSCMLPVMIGVLMLPAAIRVVRVLIPAMAGNG
ncbi:type II secretion system F family protein [Sphingomonas sp. GCM10030256]|uniref:type II secretion system F family protein n=1 Tax=Sphingomonas sp. GCM10030256 TaxID=3273427 RepID=UPI0036233336